MKKGIVFVVVGIITLMVSLVFIVHYKESIFLFIFGVILAILGLYASCVLGIDEIFRSNRKRKLKRKGWDIDNPKIIPKTNARGEYYYQLSKLQGSPPETFRAATVVKDLIYVDKNFIVIVNLE